MTLNQRLKYSVPLTIACAGIIGLGISIGIFLNFLPAAAFDFLMSYRYLLIAFVFAFIITPIVEPHFPVAWEATTPENKNKTKNKYALRQMVIVLIGMGFILLANLIVFILG